MKTKNQAKGTYWSRILAIVTVVSATLACSFIETPVPTTRLTSAPTRTPIPTWTPIPSATPTQKPTTGEISGRIIDASSSSPIPNANVTTDPPTISVTADTQGRYVIPEVLPGVYTITATKPGYTSTSVSISVTAGKTTTADVHLTAMPSPTPQSSLADGLVAYYPLDGNADDASGHGNHGTAYGRIEYVDGIVGQAAWFDGIDDYLDVPDAFFPEVTVSAFVRYDEDYVPTDDMDYRQVSIIDGWKDKENFVLAIKQEGDRILFTAGFHEYETESKCYQEVHTDSTTVVRSGTEYHVAMTYDGTAIRLYVNGALESQRNTNKEAPYDCSSGVMPDVRIGVNRRNTAWFHGLIDEVRIYNRALSEAEVQTMYREGDDAGLVAYYPFNGNADDASGHGNHGIVHGATLTTDRFGSEESAYRFDGIDDYIEVADSTSLDIERQITIAAWVRFYSNPDGSSRIVDKSHTDCRAPWNMYGLRMCCKASRFAFDVTTHGSNHISNSTSDYPPDAWHFVVGTYDGSTQKLYVNGILDSSASVSGPIGTNNEPLLIGKHRGCESQHFDGVLDDIRIYNRALSEAEVQALYEKDG